MKAVLFRSLLGFASLVVTASVGAQTERVNTLAGEIQGAMKSANYGRVLDLTYPKIVEMMGGREQALKGIETAMQGVKVLEAENEEAEDIVKAGDKQFCVVPTSMRMEVKGKTVRTKGFLLGVSADGGKQWTFVDSEGLYQGGADPKEKAKTFGLDLPDDLALPPHEKPVVDAE